MELTEYMNHAVMQMFREAIRSSRFNLKEFRFLKRAANQQKESAQRRLQSGARGISVPPFLIASIATKCNLHCLGCYARANRSCMDEFSQEEMSSKRWGELFAEACSLGISFVLLAGGEPLERADVLRVRFRLLQISASKPATFGMPLIPLYSVRSGKSTL